MEKPILLWDRSQCREMICTCHDSSSPPRFCSGCGCNVASPGHRNTLDVIDRQAARIRELEGALERLLEWERIMGGWESQEWGHARRILAEGSVKP